MSRRVTILVSTWNGEAHLLQQLESLATQETDATIDVILRDDGSSDSTLDIARTFAALHPWVRVHAGENLGVVGSFGALLHLVDEDTDLVMLCDQDDVWLPDKVASALADIDDLLDDPRPTLHASRSVITDENLRPIGETNLHPRGPSFPHAMIQTLAPGHTMAFNRALFTLARDHWPTDRILMHDAWLYLLASAFGIVSFDRGTHTLYRTHAHNTLGYDVGVLGRLRGRVRRILTQDRSAYTLQVMALCDELGGELTAEDRGIATGFAYSQRTVWLRASYLRRHPIVHETRLTSLVAMALYLVGRYRPTRR